MAKWTHAILGSNGSNGSFRYPEKRKILVVSEKNWLFVKNILAVSEKILVVSEKMLVVREKVLICKGKTLVVSEKIWILSEKVCL